MNINNSRRASSHLPLLLATKLISSAHILRLRCVSNYVTRREKTCQVLCPQDSMRDSIIVIDTTGLIGLRRTMKLLIYSGGSPKYSESSILRRSDSFIFQYLLSTTSLASHKMAALSPEEIQYMQKHIEDDQRANLYACVACCAILPFIAVFLRFLARRRIHAPIKADDYLILLTLVIIRRATRTSIFTDAQQGTTYGNERLYYTFHIRWNGQTYHLCQKPRSVRKGSFGFPISFSWY